METLVIMNREITHLPVLIDQIIYQIKNVKQGLWIDATFGLGGYSRAFLENTNCNVFAIDRDPDVRNPAKNLLNETPADAVSLVVSKISFLICCATSVAEWKPSGKFVMSK